MKARLLSAGALALCLLTGPAQADVDVGIWFEGAAIHGDGFSLYIGGPYYRDRYIVTRPHYTRHYYRYDKHRYHKHGYHKRFGHRPYGFDRHRNRHDFRHHHHRRHGGAIHDGRRGSRIHDRHHDSRLRYFRDGRRHFDHRR
ncbi:hypothetical protein [Marinobacterium aestuariivivens]|uniref:Uncharacterized protein n=1 Tax=Marinobacterium aestuariivivens TaxID=1698799 RepID=A0ABW2A1M6_9GAMM